MDRIGAKVCEIRWRLALDGLFVGDTFVLIAVASVF